jgi:hypothetical protein
MVVQISISTSYRDFFSFAELETITVSGTRLRRRNSPEMYALENEEYGSECQSGL